MSTTVRPIALVAGRNKGIGHQIAKDLFGHGFPVLVCSRNLENGEAAVTEIRLDAVALQLERREATS